MKLKIEFNVDNASFYIKDGEFDFNEFEMILLNVLHYLSMKYTSGHVKDSNGNSVGYFELIRDSKE